MEKYCDTEIVELIEIIIETKEKHERAVYLRREGLNILKKIKARKIDYAFIELPRSLARRKCYKAHGEWHCFGDDYTYFITSTMKIVKDPDKLESIHTYYTAKPSKPPTMVPVSNIQNIKYYTFWHNVDNSIEIPEPLEPDKKPDHVGPDLDEIKEQMRFENEIDEKYTREIAATFDNPKKKKVK